MREATEDEIKASVSKARREAQAAAEETRPPGCRRRVQSVDGRLPHFLSRLEVKGHLTSPAMREVRIRDTLTGELRRARTGRRSGSTPVGRRSTAASTSATRGRSSSSRCFARFLRSEGYRPKLVVNVTDINDKIYVAAREAGEPRRSSRRR